MARRGPSHPGWENPPRLENFPRLRSRDEHRANEPLLVAAVGIALIMVALILFPILTSPKSGGLAGGGGGTQAPIASGPAESPTPQGSPTPTAAPTLPDGFFVYRVLPGDFTLKIAQRFNLQLWELELANPQIKDFTLIQAGQIMYIPPPNLLTLPPSSGP
jgi:LysM repeat protein